MNTDWKITESSVWNSTIENIAMQLGTISASSTGKESPEVSKKRRSVKPNSTENDDWKSKEKSLSEEPLGLDGLRKAEERKSREKKIEPSTPSRHPMERRSCRLRFKSPSDNLQCREKTNLHLASLVKNNKEKLQSHLKLGRNAVSTGAITPIAPPVVPRVIATATTPRSQNNPRFKQWRIQEESPQSGKRQALKRRARSD